jgi:hypothetical protein
MGLNLVGVMDILARTPAVMRRLLADLPEPLVRATEGAGTFSPFDVLGHLIDGEETDWIVRARIILAGGPDPRFEPFDRFRHRDRNSGRAPSSLLDEFERLRRANLDTLREWRLSASQLDLPGVHPTLGTVTLGQLMAAWVVHDLGHLAQISRVLAKQYCADVGPWVQFMPVLTDREPPRS